MNMKYVFGTFLFVLILINEALSGIKISMVPKESEYKLGEKITIPVVVDFGEIPEELGSITAIVTWNAKELKFDNYYFDKHNGPKTILVNTNKVNEGKLTFSSVSPKGLPGRVEILSVSFKPVKTEGLITLPRIKVKSIAAAKSYVDLLPFIDKIVSATQVELKN